MAIISCLLRMILEEVHTKLCAWSDMVLNNAWLEDGSCSEAVRSEQNICLLFPMEANAEVSASRLGFEGRVCGHCLHRNSEMGLIFL